MAVSVNAHVARITASQRSAISLRLSGHSPQGRAPLPRRPNFRQNEPSEVLAGDPVGIVALAGGEIGAERQLCPTGIDEVPLSNLHSNQMPAHAIAGIQNNHSGAFACHWAME